MYLCDMIMRVVKILINIKRRSTVKKKYVPAELDFYELSEVDVIRTSGEGEGSPDDPFQEDHIPGGWV